MEGVPALQSELFVLNDHVGLLGIPWRYIIDDLHVFTTYDTLGHTITLLV
jgi:hypothetical protein